MSLVECQISLQWDLTFGFEANGEGGIALTANGERSMAIQDNTNTRSFKLLIFMVETTKSTMIACWRVRVSPEK